MEKQIMEGTVGEIRMFAGKKPPKNWAFCHGQLIDMREHEELYAIFGTTYGGDGIHTIALPDLRGRVPIGSNIDEGYYNDEPIKEPVGPNFFLEFPEYLLPGDMGGESKAQMSWNNLPPHGHELEVRVTNKEANTTNPNSILAKNKLKIFTPDDAIRSNHPDWKSKRLECEMEGEGAPFENTAPSLGINYIIAIKGVMPETNQL